MRTESATVTAPNGDRWAVTYRPGVQRKRTGLGNANGGAASRYVRGILANYGSADGTVRCAACEGTCGVGRGVQRPNGDLLAAAEGDRVVADLTGWTAEPAVPYCEATVLPVCPLHNGDEGARASLSHVQAARLEAAARWALDTYGERLP